MKIINYKRGYNNIFDCSIHGTIKMNTKEWSDTYFYLKRNKSKLFNYDMFEQDIQRVIWSYNGFYVNIRTTATKLLVKHYKLNNYKKGNYQIFVEV